MDNVHNFHGDKMNGWMMKKPKNTELLVRHFKEEED
jgi:hypothetical protein